MGDPYWHHRQSLIQQSTSVKRPRTEFDLPPSGLTAIPTTHSHLTQNGDQSGHNSIRDTNSLQSAYEQYLRSSHTSSEEVSRTGKVVLGRSVGSDLSTLLQVRDPGTTALTQAFDTQLLRNGRDMNLHGPVLIDRVTRPRETVPLPPDASNTLYIEGLPSNCTRREVAHIFRPFVGYKEARIVKKESKHRGGDPIVLCFVDFADAACAATALSALQGYKMDEEDPDSGYLRLQFSRSPGPKSAPGSRGRR